MLAWLARRGAAWSLLLAAAIAPIAVPAVAQAAFDPELEARNYSKINERAQYEHGTPEYRAALAQRAIEDDQEVAQIDLDDPERDFSANLCSHHQDGCAGDIRLYKWADSRYGVSHPVLYIGRSGAIISGHLWATIDGPPKRPGVVITTGSIQAPEELYLYAATTLAKRGYVVMTFDVQGQGRSDTYGEDPDRNENVPAQNAANFVNGTEDALHFFHSTPANRYVPLPSATTGTVHSARQERRVAEHRNAAFNPLYYLLDTEHIGIVGHSLGASAVSTVCCDATGHQADERVDAVVGWDNLSVSGGIQPRVPALGMSADYGLTPTPFTAEPNPQGRNGASNAYSVAGVDTAQINIRGGTHYEFSYIPNPGFGATLRGMDMVAWYTAAWLDKYLKGDPTADGRLLTERWRDDARSAEIDPDGDPNLFSFYYRSRIDIDLTNGGRVRCENLRELQGPGCNDASVPDDGEPAAYSYLAHAQTADDYPRPNGAAKIRLTLVPAFERCADPDTAHGGPLALPACAGARQTAASITVPNDDTSVANGSAVFKARLGDPATPEDEADVSMTVKFSDVLNRDGVTDYGGDLQASPMLRITDRGSGPTPNGPATTVDLRLPFTVFCVFTPDPSTGSNCNGTTTADAVAPGAVKEGGRAIWQLGPLEVLDGGPDGETATSEDNTVFARQGILVP